MSNLTGAQSEFEDELFRAVILEGERLIEKRFYNCRFEQCVLREAALVRCRLRDCVFVECDLSLMEVTDSVFADVRFESSHVIGVNWSAAAWPRFGALRPINFTHCALNYSTFFGVSLKQCDVIDCVAKDVDFSEADLTEATCRGTDFSDSRFLHTDLTRTDLRGATNYAINATANTLKDTRVSLPEAMALLYSLDIELEE